MLQMIYCQPIRLIVLEALAGYGLWALLGQYVRRKGLWQGINALLAAFFVFAVVYTTVLSRTTGDWGVELRLFQSFAAAKLQPEIYRTMLMNVFLFEPLGLTLANAWPGKWPSWLRILLTLLASLLLSCLVEWLQFRNSLGWAETDDVICNTLGTLLGASCLLFFKRKKTHSAL